MKLDAAEVARLAADGEGSRLEYKRGLPRRSKVARTLAAFANTRGGHLLVGVDDDGRCVGVAHADAVIAEIRDVARTEIEPSLAVQPRKVVVDGRPVVVATVGLSATRPHVVLRDGGESETPIRIGSSTRSARGPALEAMRRSSGADGRAGLSPLERDVLEWIERQGDPGIDAARYCTVAAFAKACNVGRSRARRAFVKLERAGHLVGHGSGARRTYGRP